jgi:phenylpyruvate tautomerase PptA (4-oxalocrotonate tautomerase family)
MAQVKIYGLRSHLDPVKQQLSDTIHSCMVDALKYPQHKRCHRFLPLDPEDFYYPPEPGRTDRYMILEFSMFEGRSVDTKKHLIRLLFDRLDKQLGISAQDVEMTIFETPQHNWGFRGLPGDEHSLDYQVNL